jgi:hypothetical protein
MLQKLLVKMISVLSEWNAKNCKSLKNNQANILL